MRTTVYISRFSDVLSLIFSYYLKTPCWYFFPFEYCSPLKTWFRILPTRRYLNMCKIVNSPQCLFCLNNEETLIHLFWECNVVKKFWQDLENMLRNKCINSARFSFSLELVIFGTSSFIKTDKVIEFIILFAKFYIYKCRFQDSTPNHLTYMINLKHRYLTEKLLAIRCNKYSIFQRSWFPYISVFDNNNN